jgi:hypothetical protein
MRRRGRIPWLLQWMGAGERVLAVATKNGTASIRRLNTVGGVAPAMGWTGAADVGKRAFVSYEADYFLFGTADATGTMAEMSPFPRSFRSI